MTDYDYRDWESSLDGDPMDDWDDDGYQEYKDDLAMGYINEDGTQREPDEPDWECEEHYRREALSPLSRLAEDLRDFIWGRTWQLRFRARSRWLRLTGRAMTEPDEPPF